MITISESRGRLEPAPTLSFALTEGLPIRLGTVSKENATRANRMLGELAIAARRDPRREAMRLHSAGASNRLARDTSVLADFDGCLSQIDVSARAGGVPPFESVTSTCAARSIRNSGFTRRDGLVDVIGESAKPNGGGIRGSHATARNRRDLHGVTGDQSGRDCSLGSDFYSIH
jgi:hypothetical protein